MSRTAVLMARRMMLATSAGALVTGAVTGRDIDQHFPGNSWRTREPENAGVDGKKLAEFAQLVGGKGCIARDDALLHAWGEYDKPSDVASALKPFYSYLLLKAMADKRIESLDQPVLDFQPCLRELNADLDYKDRRLTFRHLANQTACLGFREVPGTAFDYNDATMGFFWDVLINRVYKTPWERAEKEVFAPLLTEPLCFEDRTPGILARDARKTGRFAVSARDFCRFGTLFLNQGKWQDASVLDAKLAQMVISDPLPLSILCTKAQPAESCATRSIGGGANQCDHNGGYSWLWWLNKPARDGRLWFPDVPDDFYACFGHGGKEGMAVLPQQRLIVSWIGKAVHEDRELGNRAFKLLANALH